MPRSPPAAASRPSRSPRIGSRQALRTRAVGREEAAMSRASLLRHVVAFLVALVAHTADAADSLATIAPVPRPGPYPVACSNVAQDFARLAPLETADMYWRGVPRDDGAARYVTELLSEPGALTYSYTVPDDGVLFGRFANAAVTDVAIVCYPTTAANTRADYALPDGRSIPRMQRGDDAPILAGPGPFPTILFSHGYAGSPIESTYFGAQLTLASFGYVTVAPFHGDLRWSLLGFEAILDDGITAETLWRDYVAMQALRPITASRLLDRLAAHPQWAGALDLAHVGGFGVSQGGETMMLLAGGALTTTVFQDSKPVTHDARLTSAVGYIPYFGLSFLPAFGRDQEGLDGVTLPFLAIGGTDDNLAQIERIEQGVRRLRGTRSLVAITGLQHDLEPSFPDDIFTWSIVFLDAQMRGDAAAMAELQRMTGVAGGGEDVRRVDYTAPLPATGDERIVIEYYHEGFGHYFVTADADEAAGLDTGAGGWARTGLAFKATDAASTAGLPNCRFFGIFGAISTHFYTINADECAGLMQAPPWQFEKYAFRAEFPNAEDCPHDRTRVMRLFNNFKGGALNHRYTTSASEAASLASDGWILEGAVFCAKP
jgi:predicted dienelactone hydrolase